MRGIHMAVAFGLLLASSNPFEGYTKVLLPIMLAEPFDGAFGSRWDSELFVANTSDEVIEAGPLSDLACPAACTSWVGPRSHQQLNTYYSTWPGDTHGVLFLIPEESLKDIHLNLRIRDLSREELTWGTELPVVYPEDAFAGSLQILAIPTGDRFRQTLRIYSFTHPANANVSVRGFDPEGGVLFETTLQFQKPIRDDFHRLEYRPGYAEIPWLLEAFPTAASVPAIRLEITPAEPDLLFWAMVSVTNNETQHVTMMTPQG